jgi:hypothetical protein
MTNQRMAGEDLFAKLQARQQQDIAENLRVRNIMERQRRRDVAAASGKTIPFSQADIM